MAMSLQLVLLLSPNVAGAVGRVFAAGSSGAGGSAGAAAGSSADAAAGSSAGATAGSSADAAAGSSAGAAAGSSGANNVTVPAWDAPFEHQGYQCTDASLDHAPYQENNTRWSFWSVPAGEPPSGGWPIYVEFLAESMHPDVFAHNASLSCGNGWMPTGGGGYGPPTPASCTALLNQRCPVAKFRPDGQKGEGECQACIHEIGTLKTKLAGCSRYEPYQWCDFVPHEFPMNYAPFQTPKESLSSCFLPDGSWNLGGHSRGGKGGGGCTFNQFAGELWNSRSHQFLNANGIAVITLNPYVDDTWEWDNPDLANGAGLDQPYLAKLFAAMHDGTYGGLGPGVLNPGLTIMTGYSAGAQMASWQMELQARKALPPGVGVVAAVFFAGGSHMCYLNPPHALGQCNACNTGCGEFIKIAPFTCSGDLVTQGQTPCCDYCCPMNTTELWYLSHPEDYKTHPPVFLAQSERSV